MQQTIRYPLSSAASPEPFGSVLREYRLAAGLSQESLAERARISAHAVGALERGARKSPQRQTLALLSEALQLAQDDHARLALAATRPSQPRRRAQGRAGERPDVPAGLTITVPADAVETLARICDRLDGIALAIQSAAMRMSVIRLRQRRVRRRVAALSAGRPSQR
jgi:transcriptional regulator with XRE-family HTH domain